MDEQFRHESEQATAEGRPVRRLTARTWRLRAAGMVVIATSVLGVAGGVTAAEAGPSPTTYNGCENVATGAMRLLPSDLPPPLDTTCNTSTPGQQREVSVSWSQTGPQGPAGANGNTVLNGTGGPASTLGSVGDFYLDTASDVIYGPKTASGWPTSGANLIGPQGVQGPQGQQGPQGAQGNVGPQGATGATGQTGPQGPAGPAGPAGQPQLPHLYFKSVDLYSSNSAEIPPSDNNTDVSTVAYVQVPAGTYEVTADVNLFWAGQTAVDLVGCQIDTSEQGNVVHTAIESLTLGYPTTNIPLTSAVTMQYWGNVDVACSSNTGSTARLAAGGQLTVVPVSAIN
jgi:hypothetical protein